MMQMLANTLLSWLPGPLALVCAGVIALFFLMVTLRVVAFILDLIPFV